jgi:hypothetical protein
MAENSTETKPDVVKMRRVVAAAPFKEPMKHPENDYIKAGYRFERGQVPAQTLRTMLESERIDDRAEGRRLIETGRAEARQSHK